MPLSVLAPALSIKLLLLLVKGKIVRFYRKTQFGFSHHRLSAGRHLLYFSVVWVVKYRWSARGIQTTITSSWATNCWGHLPPEQEIQPDYRQGEIPFWCCAEQCVTVPKMLNDTDTDTFFGHQIFSIPIPVPARHTLVQNYTALENFDTITLVFLFGITTFVINVIVIWKPIWP